jgi:CheY-like chemotaxis protein
MAILFKNEKKLSKILIADDDLEEAKQIKFILQKSGGYQNIKIISKIQYMKEIEGYDVVILDIVWRPNSIPQHEQFNYFGFTGLQYLRTHSPQTIIILMSKHLFDLNHVEKIAEADAFFKKSSDGSQILEKIGNAIANKLKIYLELTEQTLLDAKPEYFELGKQKHEQLLREIRQGKEGLQKGSLAVNYKGNLEQFLPWLTGSNALIGLINGLIKLLSSMP